MAGRGYRRLSLIEAGVSWSCVELLGSGAPITRDLLFLPPFGVLGMGTSGSVVACTRLSRSLEEKGKKAPTGGTRAGKDKRLFKHGIAAAFSSCCPPSAERAGRIRLAQLATTTLITTHTGQDIWCGACVSVMVDLTGACQRTGTTTPFLFPPASGSAGLEARSHMLSRKEMGALGPPRFQALY